MNIWDLRIFATIITRCSQVYIYIFFVINCSLPPHEEIICFVLVLKVKR